MATGGASARACGSVGLPGANPYKAFYSMRYLSDGPGNATVLFEAAQRRTDSEALEVTRLLVEEFGVADPQTTDRMQQTCLFYAAREGHAELCRHTAEVQPGAVRHKAVGLERL
ncbi:26s proteasome non-ATPase regulatory [Cyclospora cayetanensis]|uniref:26s proteasome non-ATPase regulatory n=1 Tax=Cyclospora cayetanensis TaxID=88456 RepID=A0A1D3CZF2_9EIME|nr:26s proteasome non-ATPase regulatory [Cyclospora cayetanensis]